jgi:rhodanese-related sulfurtransferase
LARFEFLNIKRRNLMKNRIITTLLLGLLAFAGNAFAYNDVDPSTAYDMVAQQGAYILDVRTPQEWNWVGHPGANKLGDGAALEGYVLNVSYMVYHEGYSNGGTMIVNTQFVKDVSRLLGKNVAIITMCRSGSRSVKAALALEAAGFTNVYNMQTGFEGGKDASGYRAVNGWKVDGLPYNFSGVGNYKD